MIPLFSIVILRLPAVVQNALSAFAMHHCAIGLIKFALVNKARQACMFRHLSLIGVDNPAADATVCYGVPPRIGTSIRVWFFFHKSRARKI